MAKDRIVKFCARVGLGSACVVMTNCPLDVKVTWRLNFLTKSVNNSKTVQDRYTFNGRPIVQYNCTVYGLSNGSNGSDLVWSWRSFISCRPFSIAFRRTFCATFYTISTDSVLARFYCISRASCWNWMGVPSSLPGPDPVLLPVSTVLGLFHNSIVSMQNNQEIFLHAPDCIH